MLITKRKHEEDIKAKDLQIEGLNTRLSAQSTKITALEARLAPFDRARGAGGRFVKAAPQYDEVRAQFESECG